MEKILIVIPSYNEAKKHWQVFGRYYRHQKRE